MPKSMGYFKIRVNLNSKVRDFCGSLVSKQVPRVGHPSKNTDLTSRYSKEFRGFNRSLHRCKSLVLEAMYNVARV